MQRQIYKIVAIGLVAFALAPAGANATPWHRVHLEAKPQMNKWRSKPMTTYRALIFAVVVDGKDISAQGGAVGACRWLLVRPKLSLELRTNCKRRKAPVVLRYTGSVGFTFLWKPGGY